MLTKLLTSEEKLDRMVQISAVQLFSLLSEHISARSVIGDNSSAIWKILTSMTHQTTPNQLPSSLDLLLQEHALSGMINCTYEPRFKKYLRAATQPASVFTLLSPYYTHTNTTLASKALGCLGNILTDKHLRKIFLSQLDTVNTLIDTVEPLISGHRLSLGNSGNSYPSHGDMVLCKLLAVLMNCAVDDDHVFKYLADAPSKKQAKKTQAETVFPDLVFLVYHPRVSCQLRERSVGILSRFCRHKDIQTVVVSSGGLEAMLLMLCCPITSPSPVNDELSANIAAEHKGFTPLAHEHAIRGLAMCATGNSAVCMKICKFSGSRQPRPEEKVAQRAEAGAKVTGVELLLDALASNNQQLCGNAALIVSNCALEASLLSLFRGFIPTLIKVMIDDGAGAHNSAIACARLAKDPECLTKIRDLRGLEIMHHVQSKISKTKK